MKILFLSAYDAASHQRWREGLVRHLDDFHWTVLTLPPRYFAWRSRGSVLTWAFGNKHELHRKYDLLLTTSMTDLASLRGMVPSLAKIPAVVYFHENQFTYPERIQRREYLNFKLTNLYTALAADRVLFNSAFNRESFLEGVRGMLELMPDGVPPGVEDLARKKSEVLPVPLEEESFIHPRKLQRDGPVQIIWNHRWEHDKAPERFFTAMEMLMEENLQFKVHILGQRFRDVPPVFEISRRRLGDRVGEFGFIEDLKRYRRVLFQSDVVVSTAMHDFQGLSVLEAVAAGCWPLVPDRLAYREFFPAECRYVSLPDDHDREAKALTDRLIPLCRNREETRRKPIPNVDYLSWEKLGGRYRNIITRTVQSSGF